MEKYNINDFRRGWFIGNFEPSLLKANFEVGLQKSKAGDSHDDHFHKKNTEYNLVVSGKIKINDDIFVKDDVFIIKPYTVSHGVEYLEDTEILVVRDMSDPSDKYIYKLINNEDLQG